MTIDQMWERLTAHQPYADARGYGPEWARMCEERTPEAAMAAGYAAANEAEEGAWALPAAWAAWAAWATTRGATDEATRWIDKSEGWK